MKLRNKKKPFIICLVLIMVISAFLCGCGSGKSTLLRMLKPILAPHGSKAAGMPMQMRTATKSGVPLPKTKDIRRLRRSTEERL